MRIGLDGGNVFAVHHVIVRVGHPRCFRTGGQVHPETVNAGTLARQQGRAFSIGNALQWRRRVEAEVRALTS